MGRILHGMDITILTMDSFPSCREVEEDADTFEGNAAKKAEAIAQCTGRTAVADDSGLVVDALGGAPGVWSARYAGEGADDASNTEKLLRELRDVPAGKRSARFVCCIALALPGEETALFRGTVEGFIATGPRGKSGFGYDPVFYPAGQDRTFAEMGPEEKDAMSHRREALEKLKAFLGRSGQGVF